MIYRFIILVNSFTNNIKICLVNKKFFYVFLPRWKNLLGITEIPHVSLPNTTLAETVGNRNVYTAVRGGVERHTKKILPVNLLPPQRYRTIKLAGQI